MPTSAWKLAAALVLSTGLSACVVTTPVNYNETPSYSYAPDYAYADLAQCRNDNRRAQADTVHRYRQAYAAGRISPGEAQHFREQENRLEELRYQLGRDGLTLSECRLISREIARLRDALERMAATPVRDPGLAQCRDNNRRAHAEVLERYQQARAAGRISPDEAREFQAIESRLGRIYQWLSRDGLSLADCQRLREEIARERVNVERMAASPSRDPLLHSCRQDTQRAHDEVFSRYRQAQASGRISAEEAREFQGMESRLARIRQWLGRDGLSLSDCQRLREEVARERAAVERMAATPARDPQIQSCHQEQHRALGEMLRRLEQLRQDNRPITGQPSFREQEARLMRLQQRLGNDSLSLEECRQYGREIAAERTRLEQTPVPLRR